MSLWPCPQAVGIAKRIREPRNYPLVYGIVRMLSHSLANASVEIEKSKAKAL